ncbi:MAG: sulfatase [Planctomycetes bacterium]|nr:sulfatase [Planctomycetota bacterium]
MPCKPNIIFILIDDLGCRDLGCFGSGFYETPNLDRLAAEGMRFTNAYASCPVCSPTRASVMTGRYPARVGITQYIGGHAFGRLCDVPYFHFLPRTEHTIASALREGGYAVWHVGKWHLGGTGSLPEDHGFEVNLGGCGWGMPRTYWSPYGNPKLADGPAGEYLTDRLTDESIRLIQAAGDRPFFLHLCHYAVHIPIQSPPDLVEKYRRKAAAMGLDKKQSLVEGGHYTCWHKRKQRIARRVFQSDPAYAAMVENLDWNIGRLMKALAEAGKDRDTLVIFTSDNGGLSSAEGSPTCNLPYAEGKGWIQDGGTRVCQIARWPGVVAPASQCDVPVTSTDFYPTFLEAAGLPLIPAQHCDGQSIMGPLRGANRLNRDAIFWHYPHYPNQGGVPACSVRAGKWKLVEYFEDNHLELFDLEADPGELHELSTKEPAVRDGLHKRLLAWRADVKALIPQPNVNYERLFADRDVDPAET